jgi:hypothetical protein
VDTTLETIIKNTLSTTSGENLSFHNNVFGACVQNEEIDELKSTTIRK